MKYILICAALVLVAGTPASANQQSWIPVGNSDMRWTFFKLYNVTLLTDDGQYDSGQFPQALEIVYYRNINKEDLLKATADQWQKLGVPDNKITPWLSTLDGLWPDIRQNDSLRIEVDANGDNLFLHNGQPIGGIEDREFSNSFLAIWLSPDTSRPAIRKKLIGGNAENV